MKECPRTLPVVATELFSYSGLIKFFYFNVHLSDGFSVLGQLMCRIIEEKLRSSGLYLEFLFLSVEFTKLYFVVLETSFSRITRK